MKTITFDLGPSSSFVWETPPQDEIFQAHLDFQFEKHSLLDPLLLQARRLACKEFIKTIFLPYQEQITGVLLYQGTLDAATFGIKEELALSEYIKDHALEKVNHEQVKRLFTLYLLSDQLHLLLACLPEEVKPSVSFTREVLSYGESYHLLSSHRFPHMQVLADLPLDIPRVANRALALPLDKECSSELLVQIDAILSNWISDGVPFRVIHETEIFESWDGLDTIYVFDELLSEDGKWQLRGFEAAGGKVKQCQALCETQ